MPSPLPADAEWLLTDGCGGYACGAVDDRPRRRYHGLWIARADATARRHCIVAGLDERVAVGAAVVSTLHAHWHGLPAAVPPPVDVAFARWPQPTFVFRHGAFVFERSVRLVGAGCRPEGGPLLLVRWRNLGDRPLRLDVRPLLGWCDADHLIRAADRPQFDGTVAARGASWGFRPDASLPALWLSVDGVAAFTAAPAWYRGFVYETDRERGYDHEGDRWSPGTLELALPAGGSALAAFALGEPCGDPVALWRDERDVASPAATVRDRLARAADDFFYSAPLAGDGPARARVGVLAGYPWFGEWGRDVFLALPGLSLARGRADLAEAVLDGALPFLRRGLLPNIYGATVADSHYGSCDAALWFALAVQRYADAGGDEARLADAYVPALASIADSYLAGTDLGMHVADDGLLLAGSAELNATWMDAQTSSGPVTPRAGHPIEIQALWYALLAFLVERGLGRFEAERTRCGKAIVREFWLAEPKYLADCVLAGRPDPSVRPNMLVAAALSRSPLKRAERAGVVAVAEAELVTPCGLRTLSPQSVAYQGRYAGGTEARDRAYHQGTVWPWLAGFYVEAALRAATPKQRRAVEARLLRWLDGFAPELDRAGLEHVSEVFDGDPPQRPGGTFAQAWNTGELLRAFALVEAGTERR
ncbi:MAG: glycogen debranching enzyme family protein [Planctomycetes bacterium]|nr:glycogen debranching enzyme family protein [Planctomycetota bacterium]